MSKSCVHPAASTAITLTKFVVREFSIARYSMKKTITSSVEKDADTGYIGALAAEPLTHATAVNATLRLYFSTGLHCDVHIKTNHAANKFWTKVDDQLEELHSETPQGIRSMALELIYDDDVELYVTLVGSTFKTGDPVSDSSPQWLWYLSTAATQVQGEDPEMREQEEPEENGNDAGGNNNDTDPE
ncbi:hypothetical protein B0H14DRAFT_3031174 [Mycena olivaceomarginata]|nr:hypothetical protein B0H14DRAFT_3031174 [Mycena olivaceomarginata]